MNPSEQVQDSTQSTKKGSAYKPSLLVKILEQSCSWILTISALFILGLIPAYILDIFIGIALTMVLLFSCATALMFLWASAVLKVLERMAWFTIDASDQ
ncbi:MAG: hypothetical protein JJU26_11550 [Oceanicaulis sp.]|uniref:hypothetical protein n=1 Tax=Glycocaulis sp. TaxID=1969725 RepID=UPI0025BE134F|nr:hypothetical protein [Glycocaulis sp.]MCC5982339.1 hypothetical protein [Oceanicaulis sp.]MCH8522759.1 hypothetical protein [Glycocaulis sp.]